MASSLKKYGWNEWLCHTNFSFLMGASHPSEYVIRAAHLTYRGVGIADFDGVYGLARTHLELKRLKIQGALRAGYDGKAFAPGYDGRHDGSKIPDALCAGYDGKVLGAEHSGKVPSAEYGCEPPRLFHGAEIHLQKDHHWPVVLQDTLVVFAKTHLGYKNLCQLLTYSHRQGKTLAQVPFDYWLNCPKEDLKDLVAIQPMRGLIRSDEGAFLARVSKLKDIFAENFYLTVSRHLNPSEDCWIPRVIKASKMFAVPCLLSQDAFFHQASRKRLSDVLHTIRTNRTVASNVQHMFVNGERCLHTLEGIEYRFRDLPIFEQALQDSRALAESFQFTMDELRYHYPKEMLPEGYDAQSFLEKLVWENGRKLYCDPLPSKMVDLLSRELDLIQKLQFADYFLTVWDIVSWARKQGILCQGRGSAANSAVCFVLGVTSVDPALFDLLFERFVSVERGDPPDIDVDFEHERREEVIQYIYSRYGRAQAAMVANVITFRSKGALRSAGKALGVPEVLLSKTAKALDSRHFRGCEISEVLTQIRQEWDSDSAAETQTHDISYQGTEIPWTLWAEMATELKGFPRHLGIHSGGFMLADKPLNWLVPQEPATMEGRTVIQWCKDDIEDLGFFKIDILALGMLTAIRKCLHSLKGLYDKDLHLATIPQDDPSTYAMIQRADTVGTFQVESRAQMSMLPRLRPRNFYDMVIEVAIIRPGPIQGGMIHPFLRRRHGQEAITFPDDRLRPILARTLGIPIFQEQVMRIAMAVGGFSPGEANELRKKMGAWQIKGDLGPWLSRLANGMRKNGIEEKFVTSILGQMKGFADYGFPESHAVSFALIAYASCYLKCHYPAAFFNGILNSQPMGFYSPHVLLQAAKRDGVRILPICVNKSDWDSTLEMITTDNRPKSYGIRLGLRFVRGLSQKGGEGLVDQRHKLGGEWGDLEHFLQSVHIYRNDLTALAAADALSVFGVERKAALWLAEAAPFCKTLEDVEEAYAWPKESRMERVEHDFAATSTSLGPHPAEIIKVHHWCYEIPLARLKGAEDLSHLRDGLAVTTFGMVLVKQSPPSAKGMVFFTLEDETGFINLAFTPQVYKRCYKLLEHQAFLCVSGKLQKQNESHSILVTQAFAPKIHEAEVIPVTGKKQKEAKDPNLLTKKPLSATRNYM